MAYICEQELMAIYKALEPKLRASGIQTEVALVRDYLLKLALSDNGSKLGKLVIDYSPKKQAHSYRKDSDLSEDQFVRILGILGAEVPQKARAEISSAQKAKSNDPSATPKSKTVELSAYKDTSGIRHQAYVDGSFIQGSVGYGAVILEDQQVVAEIFGSVDSPDAFQSRQVGGEIQAVIEVLEWCKKKCVKEIAIFYDFQNIEKWATGQYRANTPMTMAYKQYIDQCPVAITWVKVQSHTGVALNDKADELAKKGALQLGQMSLQDIAVSKTLLDIAPPKSFYGWIIYNASLMTPKFMEQVEWFKRKASEQKMELVPLRNDQIGAAIVNGSSTLIISNAINDNLTGGNLARSSLTGASMIGGDLSVVNLDGDNLIGGNQIGGELLKKPDFVLFWDKDVRLARQLERLGLRLFNKAQTISVCDDKTLTHQVLADQSIPMPKTIFAPLVFPHLTVDEEGFIALIEKELTYPMVVKEAFGSFGAQVYLAKNRQELCDLRKKLLTVPHLYQEYIRTSHGRDVRLQVVGNEVVASMLRTSDTDFRANISAGGHMMQFLPPKSFQELAVKAAQAVGADFAGVDILFGEDEKPILCEINSNAHMKNIYECTGMDVAERIIRYIKAKVSGA
ncbi:MAG: RimK family alpha-L-glutamate ligase [Clostridia bacterium]|nr:RimK family alpha-L-glutamate ligase [Clostridia bacterium]